MTANRVSTDVLIVGGGPVGLTLAIDLARRGTACTLIERNPKPGPQPKMERCNARSMEIFRRLGIADRIRAAGYPSDASMDSFVVTCLTDPPLVELHYPTVDEARAMARARNDGTLPLEPYQLISQYTLEPILKDIAETTPNANVWFGHELVSFEQDEDGVTAQVRKSDGTALEIRAKYMVGCDGGTSFVRKQAGIQLEGQGGIMELRQALFRCDEFFAKVPIGAARHYHFADPYNTSIVVQDDQRHFAMHTRAPLGSDFVAIFREVVGVDVDAELLWVGEWRQNLLVAERFSKGRVFLAGDSAHLMIPTGGLGMNTGVGDATDLAWKLAATLAGWGGPQLLPSYDVERRAIAKRNVAASGYAAAGMREWRSLYAANIREQTPEGAATREKVARIADFEQRKCHEMTGIELGYRYVDSPLVVAEEGESPDPDATTYTPTTWPGTRVPHVWLDDGRALLDLLGPWYTVLSLGGAPTKTLGKALHELGVPFMVLFVPDAGVRAVYERDLLLVRPDGHVAWRGDDAPADPELVARVATGHAS